MQNRTNTDKLTEDFIHKVNELKKQNDNLKIELKGVVREECVYMVKKMSAVIDPMYQEMLDLKKELRSRHNVNDRKVSEINSILTVFGLIQTFVIGVGAVVMVITGGN